MTQGDLQNGTRRGNIFPNLTFLQSNYILFFVRFNFLDKKIKKLHLKVEKLGLKSEKFSSSILLR